MPKVVGDIDITQQYRTPLSSERGSSYNLTWEQQGVIASSNTKIPVDRWPFKLKDETDEQYKERMELLEKSETERKEKLYGKD